MVAGSSDNRALLVPSFGLVMGGVLWGLFWIPVREIGDLGLLGIWPGLFIYLGMLALLLPVLVVRPSAITNSWGTLLACGFFTGTAFSLYTISLFFTDVIRVLLLFYLTPVWSTILGVIVLGERVSLGRLLALGCGISGLFVILGLGVQFPWPSNLGDWLALAAGASWSIGSLLVYRLARSGVYEQMLSFAIGSIAASVLAILAAVVFDTRVLVPSFELANFTSALPLLVISSLITLPMLFLTLWPTTLLSPGRAGLLLMSEVLVGIFSAAWLTGEPFGTRELLGATLIVSAGLVEVLWPGKKRLESAPG